MAISALVVALAGSAVVGRSADAGATSVPLVCSKGPSGQRYQLRLTAPTSTAAGSTYTVRIDDVGPGNVSETGLNYLHDQAVDYVLPAGAALVDGSAHLVAGTGTDNVRAGARVVARGSTITLLMPGRVENHSTFTMPSIEFELKATGAAGSNSTVAFSQYRIVANAIVIGDVSVSCDPAPKPYTVGRVAITAPDDE
jgi:hypothetical protein